MNPVTRARLRATIEDIAEQYPDASTWGDPNSVEPGEELPIDRLLRRIEGILKPSPGL